MMSVALGHRAEQRQKGWREAELLLVQCTCTQSFFLIENIKICVASNSNTQSHYYLLLAPFQIQTRICIFIIACIAADRLSCTIITKEFLQGVEILG